MRACLGLILAGAVYLLTGPAHAQTTHPVDLDGETINFIVPDGYCLVDTDRPAEQVMFQLLDKTLGPDNELIVWFVRCEQLEKLRLGFTDSMFSDYGLYIAVVQPDGAFLSVDYLLRADVVEELSRQVPFLDIKQLSASTTQRAQETLRDPNASVEIDEFGTTGFDEHAVYMTLTGTAQLLGTQVPVVGAGGSTVMNRRLVSVMLYLITDEPGILVELDATSRRFIADWLDANPDSDN